jgi:hypothetical protein
MNSRTHFCCKRIRILNDSVAADVSVVTAAAYSTLGMTTAAIAEAMAADVTVATATSANLSTAEAAAADLPHGGRDDLILSAKLIRIAPENSSF